MIKPIKIRDVQLSNNLFMAPLAGYTDVGFRSLCKSLGAGLTYTEMISVRAMTKNNLQTRQLLYRESNEVPCAVQLFGKDPNDFALAVKNPLIKDFEIIDINMGCPAQKVVKNGSGSALLKDIESAEKIIKACVENTDKPITVKIRIGFNDEIIVAEEFVKMCERAGASAITIHGRTREQMYSGVADWEIIKKCARLVKIPVIANGDIRSIEDIENLSKNSNIAGFMIGRGALGNPQIFSQLQKIEANISKLDAIKKHIEILLKYFPERYVLINMRKHICFYLRGEKNSAETRAKVVRMENFEDVFNTLEEFFTAN